MEQNLERSLECDALHLLPDLNYGNEVDNTEQFLPLPGKDVEFASLTIEEMELRLEIGQPMENELVAFALYCIYARAKGFSVRKDVELRFPDGYGVKARDFVCSCAGNKDEKSSLRCIPSCVRPTFRCQCKAKLRVARLKGQNWRVTSLKKEHNHDMYPPNQTHLLRSARNVSSEMKHCFETMVKCGIPIARAYEFMESISHGRENVGCTQKDVYNSLRCAKKQIDNGDAARLVDYFSSKSNKEHYFYWSMEKDENDRLTNFFFRGYRSSIDYEYFGDVLSVDTTYRTNKYNMICCPFVGINHHMQTIMFGFAFMSDETQSSFEWLFREFLNSMGGKQPETIFTDQCPAMMKAITKVFTESHHRLCHWHINQNAPSHFGDLKGNKDFKGLWNKCMTGCQSEEEFEYTWKHMVDNYGIGTINWFNIMCGLRHKWATAFSCHRFCAGLKATSRSEGTNAALKKNFGGATSSLYDCVFAYEKVLESWRTDEGEKDSLSQHGKLPVGQNPWLIQVSKAYTMEIFILFQNEINDLINYAIIDQQEIIGSSFMCFTVISRGKTPRNFVVQLDTLTLDVSCVCHKFETMGILCSHILKVFDRVNLDYIPTKYIRKRWTKIVTNRICDARRVTGNSGASEMVFVNEMMKKCYKVATKSKYHKETRSMLAESLGGVDENVDAWFENLSLGQSDPIDDLGIEKDCEVANEMFVRDPLRVRSRGITNLHQRHWDAKGKKAKGRGESSRGTSRGTKKRGQSSRIIDEECPSQEAHVETSGAPYDYPFQSELRVSRPWIAQSQPSSSQALHETSFSTLLFPNQSQWSYANHPF